MKRLIILSALFAICKGAFGQAPLTTKETRFDFFDFSLGGGATVMNNKDFNNWTETYYHNKKGNAPEGYADFYFIGKDYDGGLQLIAGNELYQTGVFYLGRRITPVKSPITSFINVGIGSFIDNVYDYAPIGYLRRPDEVGQRLYMQNYSGILSLQVRSYINSLSFSISRNERLYFRSGFYVNFNCSPWGTNWQYGYDKKTEETDYDDDGDPYTQTNSKYTSHAAIGVPALASTFWDAGAFVSITLSTVRKHKFYSR